MAKAKRQPQNTTGAPVTPNNKQTRQEAQQKAKQRQEMLKWLAAGLVIAVAGIAILMFATRDGDNQAIAGGPENVSTVVPGPVIPSYIPLDGTTMGEPTAPILVVEYGDYQCPNCINFARASQDQLIEDYVESGKIRFEFHPYPIVGSSNGSFDQEGESFRAAEAAMCANDQGQFWTYHDLLYANSLGEFQGSFTVDRLKSIARQAPGMDLVAFDSCVDNRSHTQTVLDLGEAALRSNVTGTPTFLVNGKPVIGADYEDLASVIEEQLAGP